jgi:uncharacterized protein YcnI
MAALAAAFTTLLLPAAAAGHVTVQPGEDVPAGGFTRLDVRVPNERDDASTKQVRLQLPPGFYFVSTEPVPGWTAKLKRQKLATPATLEGEKIDEEVRQVTFSTQGNHPGPGEFQDFGLSVRVPEQPGTLTFKAIQEYSNGETVRWIGPPDSDEPAPQVRTVASSENAAATEPAAAASSGGKEDDDGDALAIIALVAAGLALVVSLAVLLRRRRA